MTETTEQTRRERYEDAMRGRDDEYLQGHEAGRQIAFNGVELDETQDIPQSVRDGFESATESMDALPESQVRNKVYTQPHPLGGVEVIVFGVDGTRTSARIRVEEAAVVASILQAWVTTMTVQTYSQMAQQAQQATESGIVIPGR